MTEFIFKIAPSVKYGKYKCRRAWAETFVKIIKQNVDIICDMLDLPERVIINVAPIRTTAYGYWYDGSNTMKIDPCRKNMDHLFSTFFHELVHAEQYKQGRLTRKLNPNANRFMNYWNDVPYKKPSTTKSKKSFDKYKALPWEAEAFARQNVLTAEFIKGMMR